MWGPDSETLGLYWGSLYKSYYFGGERPRVSESGSYIIKSWLRNPKPKFDVEVVDSGTRRSAFWLSHAWDAEAPDIRRERRWRTSKSSASAHPRPVA